MTSGPGSAAGPVAGLTTSNVPGAFHQGNLHVLLHPAWPLFRPAASPARLVLPAVRRTEAATRGAQLSVQIFASFLRLGARQTGNQTARLQPRVRRRAIGQPADGVTLGNVLARNSGSVDPAADQLDEVIDALQRAQMASAQDQAKLGTPGSWQRSPAGSQAKTSPVPGPAGIGEHELAGEVTPGAG
jgi:hypothetical protein